MHYKNGIHYSDAEFKAYQEKANKWDQYLQLVREEMKIRSRVKQIGQEKAKILGVTAKYEEQ